MWGNGVSAIVRGLICLLSSILEEQGRQSITKWLPVFPLTISGDSKQWRNKAQNSRTQYPHINIAYMQLAIQISGTSPHHPA
jgi:hypothetical protein